MDAVLVVQSLATTKRHNGGRLRGSAAQSNMSLEGLMQGAMEVTEGKLPLGSLVILAPKL